MSVFFWHCFIYIWHSLLFTWDALNPVPLICNALAFFKVYSLSHQLLMELVRTHPWDALLFDNTPLFFFFSLYLIKVLLYYFNKLFTCITSGNFENLKKKWHTKLLPLNKADLFKEWQTHRREYCCVVQVIMTSMNKS